MDIKTEKQLIKIAKNKQTRNDPSHDFNHVLRVYNLAKYIGRNEKADFDILIPAALFHDIIVYRKDDPKSKNETDESALFAENVLRDIGTFPKNKIRLVSNCIKQCSFSKGTRATTLESKILQDADRLEATGAISIMRTFSSGGQMNRDFYPPEDPLCKKRLERKESSLDLFFDRLLVVEKRMHTNYAKNIAKGRTRFVNQFLKQLEVELEESSII